MNVLAISGSLRAASINSALLRAAAQLAPPGMQVRIFEGIGALPLFNLDLEAQLPEAIGQLRHAVASADAIVIASPEYAHGVSGVIKNALDWLVSLEAFYLKPIALLNAQPQAKFSDPALRETLTVMSAKIIESASVGIMLDATSLTEVGMLASPSVCAAIVSALLALRDEVQALQTGG
jgi:NAD(P)H-dependent FMN reductase